MVERHPGVRLALAGRSEEKLSNLAAEISLASDLSLKNKSEAADNAKSDSENGNGNGVEDKETVISTHAVDVFDAKEVEKLMEEVAGPRGLDGVASCVGSVTLKPAHATSPKEFEEIIRLNLFTTFNVIRGAAKSMMKNPNGAGGAMVFCSSAVALHGIPNHEAIAAAKGGVASLAQSAAATYAPKNIRVNAVAPGLTRTPLTARITNNEGALKASKSMHALGRIGEPYDVAAAMAFLLDPRNSFITGQVIGIDGGLSCLKPQ